jgi:hypothetical protein
MKKLLLSLTALMLTSVMFAQKKADDVAKFKSESIDLGKIKQDNPVTGLFEVTNIGKEPLLIEQANPTCGCTISDYTKEPIAPGKTGTIKATYNAKNVGMFEKHLTVKFAGIDELKSITIKGEVMKNEEAVVVPPAPEEISAPAVEPVKTETKVAAPATATTPAKKATTTKKTKKATTTKKPQ